jgi:hypothetical protein
MSDDHKRINPNEYLCIANVFCLTDFDAPIVIRGYLIGVDEKALEKEIERWAIMRTTQTERKDGRARMMGCIVQQSKLCNIHSNAPDLSGIEDIRALLESRDQQNSAEPLDPALVQYEQQMRDFTL